MERGEDPLTDETTLTSTADARLVLASIAAARDGHAGMSALSEVTQGTMGDEGTPPDHPGFDSIVAV